MKRRLWIQTAAGLSGGLMTACRQPKKTGPVTLRVLNWNDYLCPELLRKFEKTHRCSVILQTYSSNLELHKLLEDPAFEVDVVVPSSYYLDTLNRAGLIAPLDRHALPTMKHLDQGLIERFGLNPLLAHGVPYLVGPTGIAATQKAAVVGSASSWSVFDRPVNISVLDDMVEALGAAVLAGGQKRITWEMPQLAFAKDRLSRWLTHGVLDGDTYGASLRNGEREISHAYPGDVMQMQGGVDDLTFTLPTEGFIVTVDMLAVTSMSANTELAHQFINYMCEPANCAENMCWTMYRAPNRSAFELARPKLASHLSITFLDNLKLPGQIVSPLTEAAFADIRSTWDAIAGNRT